MDTVKETDASDYDMEEVSLLLSDVCCTTIQPYDISGRQQSELICIIYSSDCRMSDWEHLVLKSGKGVCV